MKNELEDLLRNKMSLDELNVNEPNDELVAKARKMVASRKRKSLHNETLFDGIKGFFYAELKVYQVVLFALVIVGCFFWFSKPSENSPNKSTRNSYMSNETAITSSTILAAVNHKYQGNSSANTSTAMASIKTFVTRN